MLLEIEDGRGHDPTTLASLHSVRRATADAPILRADVLPIHLHDAPALQAPPAGQDGAQRHHARVLPGREDRRARLQRLRQVDAAADHGRRRSGVPRRGRARARARPSGCSSRSRTSTSPRTSRDNVEDGVAETKALLDRFNELAANYSEETAEEFGNLQDKIEAADAWNLDTQLEYAMDALRLPPPDADVSLALRRRAPARGALPAAAARARPAAARRADQPPRRRVGRLARAAPRRVQGRVVAVTHDRYFLDNVAGWILELDRGQGIPYEGNYSGWLEQKQARLAQEERTEKAPPAHDRRRARMGAHQPQGPAHEVQGAPRPLRGAARRGAQRQARRGPDPHPAGTAPRRDGDRGERALRKGFGDRLLIEDLSFSLPRGGIVGVIGANGAGKTTLFRMITGEEQPDGGTLASATPSQLAYVDQSRDALDPAKTVWEEISGGYDQIKVGEREVNSRQYTAGFNFHGSDQQTRVGKLSGGERNRVHLAKLLRSRRQPAAARRADQRPRRRHAARARGGAALLRRLRRRDLPRSLVPRPRRHARAGLRGRLAR